MVSEPEELSFFASYLEDIKIERKFSPIRDPCTKNAKFKGGQPITQCQEAAVFRRLYGSIFSGSVQSLMTRKKRKKKETVILLGHYYCAVQRGNAINCFSKNIKYKQHYSFNRTNMENPTLQLYFILFPVTDYFASSWNLRRNLKQTIPM